MDQEQIFDRGARVTLETGKQLFQFLAYAAQQLYKTYDEHKQIGEQSFKNFNQSSLTKDHIDFLEADVNLKKFTDELKNQVSVLLLKTSVMVQNKSGLKLLIGKLLRML